MEGNQEKPIDNEYLDEGGYFKVGNPGGGRPKDTEAAKALKKASRQIIEEYKKALTESLPMIQPIIIAKALEGDIASIKEIHDRTMDKAKQPTDITSGGEPISINFDPIFNKNESPRQTEGSN